MTRRKFIAGLTATLSASRIGWAQDARTIKRLAMVRPTGPLSRMTPNGPPAYKAFFDELGKLGYVEGQNLVVLRFSAQGHQDRYRTVVQQAIDAAPDVIWCGGNAPAMLENISTTIPIVLFSSDPVAFRFTSSLARPSGNVTGVTADGGLEIWGKRLSLLKEVVEPLRKPYFLAHNFTWEGAIGQAAKKAADQLGLSLAPALLKRDVTTETYAQLFEEIDASGGDGMIVDSYSDNVFHSGVITSLAARHRIPTIYPYREFVADGGLLSYGIDIVEVLALTASQVGAIFRGAKIADIPFIQPIKVQLFVNIRTANALGVTIPAPLLARADEVIE